MCHRKVCTIGCCVSISVTSCFSSFSLRLLSTLRAKGCDSLARVHLLIVALIGSGGLGFGTAQPRLHCWWCCDYIANYTCTSSTWASRSMCTWQGNPTPGHSVDIASVGILVFVSLYILIPQMSSSTPMVSDTTFVIITCKSTSDRNTGLHRREKLSSLTSH